MDEWIRINIECTLIEGQSGVLSKRLCEQGKSYELERKSAAVQPSLQHSMRLTMNKIMEMEDCLLRAHCRLYLNFIPSSFDWIEFILSHNRNLIPMSSNAHFTFSFEPSFSS